MLEENSLPYDPIFKGMYNIVFIDEKWYEQSKQHKKYYLMSKEEEPHRTCKSTSFMGKVMFLAAAARPRFDIEDNEVFDEKIGIFPLITKEPVKRSCVNRTAGTLETEPITSVTRDIIRAFLIERVLPVIREKWPSDDRNTPIFIQQDNAMTYVDPSDPEFCQAAQQDGFHIQLKYQPANSPDFNILDLRFFNAIKSLRYNEAPKTTDELIASVEKAFESFSSIMSNRIFLTLQLCMKAVMEVGGGNNYKIAHIGKAALERQGQLPRQIRCDAELVRNVLDSCH